MHEFAWKLFELLVLPYLSHILTTLGQVRSGRRVSVAAGIMHGDEDEAIPLEASVAWDGFFLLL